MNAAVKIVNKVNCQKKYSHREHRRTPINSLPPHPVIGICYLPGDRVNFLFVIADENVTENNVLLCNVFVMFHARMV